MERGGMPEMVASFVRRLEIEIVPFDDHQAVTGAALNPQAREHGLCFADCACLALGVLRHSPVLTANPKMALLTLPIKVKVIRNGR
jgi:ribonuclease VapC